MTKSEGITRCPWAQSNPIYFDYHDHEWGKPVFDDRYLFEKLCLEGAQAGLSWLTVLKKRARYQEQFDNFEPQLVAQFDELKIQELLSDPGIIRNRQKINSAINNAKAFVSIQEEFGSFSDFIWAYVDGKPIDNKYHLDSEIPASTKSSEQLSRDLKKRGFSFVGPTICYAYMQGIGMFNDHLMECDFR